MLKSRRIGFGLLFLLFKNRDIICNSTTTRFEIRSALDNGVHAHLYLIQCSRRCVLIGLFLLQRRGDLAKSVAMIIIMSLARVQAFGQGCMSLAKFRRGYLGF